MSAPARPPGGPAFTNIGSGLTSVLEVTLRVLSGKPADVNGRHVQLYSAHARSREPGTAIMSPENTTPNATQIWPFQMTTLGTK